MANRLLTASSVCNFKNLILLVKIILRQHYMSHEICFYLNNLMYMNIMKLYKCFTVTM